jgi:hypothetical protein
MKHRPPLFRIAALLVGFTLPLWSVASGGDTFTSYSGTATAERSDKFLYREHHVLHFHDGRLAERVVLYTCRDGAPFARKTVSYSDPLAPDFLLEDASNGMRQGIRTRDNTREVFFRDDRAAVEKAGTVPRAADSVADAGFDGFVRAHWQSLMDGRSLGMNFLVPSRLEEMSFKVQHLRRAQMDGVDVEVFRLKLSGAFGWIAPTIDVYYGAEDHVLMRYVGVSDLRDAAHDNYVANIDFRPADRREDDARAMSDARGARLAPCR